MSPAEAQRVAEQLRLQVAQGKRHLLPELERLCRIATTTRYEVAAS